MSVGMRAAVAGAMSADFAPSSAAGDGGSCYRLLPQAGSRDALAVDAAHAEVFDLEEFLDAVYRALAADAAFLHAAERRDLGRDDALVALLINNQGLRRYGFSGEQGIDNHFADEAAASRKPIIGLETPDYQMNLLYWRFSTVSDEAQDKMLLWTILHVQAAARHLGALIPHHKSRRANRHAAAARCLEPSLGSSMVGTDRGRDGRRYAATRPPTPPTIGRYCRRRGPRYRARFHNGAAARR
jgi:hypothetical protein